jgi:uncharacterized protein
MMDTEKIFKECRVVAVVGVSSDPERASHRVFKYLGEHGYEVIPVTPKEEKVLGNICYPNLLAVPVKIDVVDIFRRAEECLPIIEDAIKVGAKTVWMQEGIINKEAAEKAEKAGLSVVMDLCMMKEHRKLSG